MAIIAVDPGTSNTGLVYMDERRVVCAKTYHYQKVGYDQDKLMQRAAQIAKVLSEWTYDKPHEVVVMEGYIGYPGMQGGFSYQTPYLCGFLHSELLRAGEQITVQTSRQVLNRRTKGNVRYLLEEMLAGEEVWGESSKCTNEHTRSALMHGIYYYMNKEAR